MLEMQQRVAVAAQVGAMQMRNGFEGRIEASSTFRWVWIVLIGVVVIAAAIAFVYCRNAGYDGFTGNLEWVKGPLGIKIGVKLGCY